VKSTLVRAALLLSALSMPFAAPAAKAPARSASAKAGWLATAHRTSEDAMVIGNPAARVKLVEYLSLTCPHCAVFSGEAMQPLQRDYIAKGLVSLEVRHAVRDPLDFVASLLLRCEAPAQYLPSIEALFATQQDWFEKAQAAASGPAFDALSPERKIPAIAKAAGFDAFFARRGMTPKAQAACMADKRGQDQLSRMTGNSWDRDKIPGTPLLMVNGERKEDVRTWASLEPLIKAALR
jgi:protein-disulfide isomerase